MPYLEALARSLCQRFNDEKALIRHDEVQGLLHSEIQAFHLRDVAPYADPPQISMVLGYQRNGHDGLWCTDSGTITEAHSFGAVGIGGPLVETLLGRVWKLGHFDVGSASALAVLAVSAAKESVPGCGSVTDVCCLYRNNYYNLKHDLVQGLEAAFKSFVAEYEPVALRSLLGAEGPAAPRTDLFEVIKARVEKLTDAVRDSLG